MTDAEQHRIIGEVVSELAAAKKRLACLEAEAEKMYLEFGLLSNWLQGHFPSGVQLAEGLSVEGALALIAEVKETKERIQKLEARRAHLGI